jgi:hypothetical protein
MLMYHDMALPGGATSSYGTGPPLALYDLIGQKGASVSYAYSCDMSVLGEEEEAAQKNDDVVVISKLQSTTSLPAHERGSHEDKHTTQDPSTVPDKVHQRSQTSDDSYTQPTLPQILSHPNLDEARPPITQRETFPQPSKRPNWQMIRYQTTPGRAHKAQLEAWVSGWSAAVGELGDDTYCACADSVALPRSHGGASDRPPSPAVTLTRDEKDLVQIQPGGGGVGGGRLGLPRGRARQHGGLGQPRRSVSFVCHNCARQPSPAVIPDHHELVLPPASGAGRVAMKCKLAWRRIVDRAVRRPSQSPDKLRNGVQEDDRPGSTTPLSRGVGLGGGDDGGYDHDNEDDDDNDDEVDLDKLSRSSEGDRRAGHDIAERQARLRRAQRLLRKASQPLGDAG